MRSYMYKLLVTGLALGLTVATAHGQELSDDVAAQIEELKKGQQEIRRQLQELRQLLQARQAPAAPAGPNVAGKTFDLGDNPTKGASSARLTLVEFTDYQ